MNWVLDAVGPPALIAGLALGFWARITKGNVRRARAEAAHASQPALSADYPAATPGNPADLRAPQRFRTDPCAPVLPLTMQDAVLLHDAYPGFFICGEVGSGKTTGPGSQLAYHLLRQGAGFCVLTAKVDEFARWQRLCRDTGREADLIRFAPGERWTIDLLDYELGKGDAASVESAAQLLDTLIKVSNRQSKSQGDDEFWALLTQRIFRRAIMTVWLGTGHCNLSDVYRAILSAAKTPEEAANSLWRTSSFLGRCLSAGELRRDMSHESDLCNDFWLKEWPSLSEKTRSCGETAVVNVLDKFLSGPVASMVCAPNTNLTPEDVTAGKVVVVDMPFLRWREPGQFVQIIWKLLVQRAVLARDLSGDPRPVVIWQDEGQLFATDQDVEVQEVARQSRLINVVLTQNLNVVYRALGGSEEGKQLSHAWIGNLGTKILCGNSCPETNHYFSQMLGIGKRLMEGGSANTGAEYDPFADMMGHATPGASVSWSEQYHPLVMPDEFTRLRRGGPGNDWTVDAFVFMNGHLFSNGKPWMRASLRQRV